MRALDRHGAPRLAAAIASFVARDRRFSVDRDGDRLNRQGGMTIACPNLMPSRLAYLKSQVRDSWLWDYDPRPGDTVLDIGAGIGEEMLALAPRVGRLVCVEANGDDASPRIATPIR